MCMAVHRWHFAALLLACVSIAAPAQDAQPKDEQPIQEIPFWQSDRGEQTAHTCKDALVKHGLLLRWW